MTDLFMLASRKAFRYPTTKNELTTEQLWSLPLVGKGSNVGFDLDTIARTLHRSIKALGEESFVDVAPNPAQAELQAKLEVVKVIIGVRQKEAKEAADRAARAVERKKILDAIESQKDRALASASLEELERRYAALAD